MLPLGRKNSRRCSECDITCHAGCAHLVPDFCGMSMETANQLLQDWRTINRAKEAAGGKGRPQPSKLPTHRQSSSATLSQSDYQMSQVNQGMGQMRLDPTSPQQSHDPFGREPHSPPMGAMNVGPQDPRYQQYPQSQPGPGQYSQGQGSPAPPRLPPGARMPVPIPGPQGYQDPSQQQRPPPGYDQSLPPFPQDQNGSRPPAFDVSYYSTSCFPLLTELVSSHPTLSRLYRPKVIPSLVLSVLVLVPHQTDYHHSRHHPLSPSRLHLSTSRAHHNQVQRKHQLSLCPRHSLPSTAPPGSERLAWMTSTFWRCSERVISVKLC
jgi:hypothetical protein